MYYTRKFILHLILLLLLGLVYHVIAFFWNYVFKMGFNRWIIFVLYFISSACTSACAQAMVGTPADLRNAITGWSFFWRAAVLIAEATNRCLAY